MINNIDTSVTTMSHEEQVKIKLTLEALKLCKRYDITDSECQPYVRAWLKKVPKHYRPTEEGVLMSVKRKLWGLSE